MATVSQKLASYTPPKTTTPVKPAVPTAPKMTAAQLAARKAELEKSLASIKSAAGQAQLDSILSAAKKDGVTLDAKLVSQAQTTIKTAVDKAAADKAAADKAAATKAAADKAAAAQAAAAKAEADKIAAAFKPPDPNATIKNIMAGKGGSDTITDPKTGTKYYLKPINPTTAQWFAAKPGSSYANAVNANGVISQSEGATMATLTKDRQAWYQANPTETAKQAAAAIEAKAKAEQAAKEQAAAKPVAPLAPAQLTKEQQAAAAALQNQMMTAKTQSELDAIIKQAADQRLPLNQGYVDRAKTIVKQAEARTAAADLQAKTQDYETQVKSATSVEQINNIAAKALADNITVNPSAIQQAQGAIKQQQATADFAKTLGPATAFTSRIGPNGQEFTSLADDPVTGTKGGWYQVAGTGLQKIGTDGRPTGAVIPADQFNQQRQEAQSNYNTFATQQKKAADAAKLADSVKKFEAELPQPGTAKYQYLLNNRFNITGPNGQDYQPVVGQGWAVSNIPLGENGRTVQIAPDRNTTAYTPVGQPTAPAQTLRDIQGVFDAKAAADNAAQLARRQQLIAEQRAKRQGPDILGDLDKFVNKTIGWKTIATIAGGAIAGPWGATFANAAAGAVAGESIESIAKGAALTFAMAYGTQALSQAISESVNSGLQTGVLEGTNDVFEFANDLGSFDDVAYAMDDVYQLGELPQSVIDMAMATDDPIAALNAANGFGNVDTNYLQSIGATDDLIAVAEAHNAVNGFTGGGYDFVGGDYSSIPEEFIGPPAELAQGPVAPVEQFGPPAELATGPVAPTTPNYGFSDAELEAIRQGDIMAQNPLPGTQYASTGPQGSVTVDVSSSPVEPPGGWGSQPMPNIPSDITLPGDLGGTYYPNGIPLEEVVVTATRELGLTPAQIIALGGVAAATVAVATMGSAGAATAANAAMVPPSTTPPPVETPAPVEPAPVPVEPTPPVVETPVPVEPAPPVETPVPPSTTPPVVETPVPVEPVPVEPPVVETPPGPVEPPVPVEPAPVEPIPPVVETPPPVVETPPPVEPVPPVAETPVPVEPVPVEPVPVEPVPVEPVPVEPVPVEPVPVEPVPVEPVPVEPTPPVEPVPNTPPTTPPASEVPVYDYSTPYEGPYSNQSVLERYIEGKLSFDNITGLIAAGLVLPSVMELLAGAPQPTIKRPNYGPLPPINWGAAGGLVMPGVNPGFVINPAQQPFYQTTDPVQSKYAYTQRPLITRPEDVLSTYQDRQYAPAVPFGLRESQRPYDLAQVLNQISQQPLNPNFVGYSNYPTAGYQPPVFNPGQAVNQAQYIPTGVSTVMSPIAPT
jgi:hypothetical protein